MTAITMGEPVRNPFCTRSVSPGRIPPFDDSGRALDALALLAALEERGGSAALVGPHGSGKTTLLWHVAAALEARGRRVERVRLSDAHSVVAAIRAVIRQTGGGIVCADSWERLGRPWADLVRWCAGILGARLVVTAHHPGPLPTLWTCRTSPALLAAIVTQLPHDAGPAWPERERQIEDAFRQSAGDIREALFMLYDRFEERARAVRMSGLPGA